MFSQVTTCDEEEVVTGVDLITHMVLHGGNPLDRKGSHA
jgi:hypothetical protein